MAFKRVPETNSFGLVLPPSPEVLARVIPYLAEGEIEQPNEHHLYFPEPIYDRNPLAKRFRRHRLNVIYTMRSIHNGYHKVFDGVPIPRRQVMIDFLVEAEILGALLDKVRSVENMDKAIANGTVIRFDRLQMQREQRVQEIKESLGYAASLCVVPEEIAIPKIEWARFVAEACDYIVEQPAA